MNRQELEQRGVWGGSIDQLVRVGSLRRISRGWYVWGEAGTPEEEHLLLTDIHRGRVLALESAALVHGLPVAEVPEHVQGVEPGSGRAWLRDRLQLHTAPLPDAHVAEVDGRRVTSPARTVVDLARVRGIRDAVITWDAACRTVGSEGQDRWRVEVEDALDVLVKRRGIRSARELATFASPLAESPMESVSRWMLHLSGFPRPVEQYVVRDQDGEAVARVDFGWPEHGVVGEYDGEGKYFLDDDPEAAFMQEKWRQQRVEALGWEFARWGKADVASVQSLRASVQSAFMRAARRPAPLGLRAA